MTSHHHHHHHDTINSHITAYIATSGAHPYSHRLAELGSGTVLQMMLVDSLVHSDLHPGNILVRLERPRGLLGLADAAVARVLGAAGGGGGGAGGGSGEEEGGAERRQQQLEQQQQQGEEQQGQGGGAAAAAVASAAADAGDSHGAGAVSLTRRKPPRASDSGAAATLAARLAAPLRARLEAARASWLQPRLVLLDVGMATELTPDDTANMVGLFKAFSALDGAAAADWVLRFSGDRQTCRQPEAFRRDMRATFDAVRAANAAADGWGATPFSAGADALAAVLEHVRVHGVALPGHICAVVVTTLVLEGWSNK